MNKAYEQDGRYWVHQWHENASKVSLQYNVKEGKRRLTAALTLNAETSKLHCDLERRFQEGAYLRSR